MMRSRGHRQSGFVLLFTLVVLMIAGVALAASARRSVTTALRANRAVADLQDRWTTLTAHRELLPKAEEILAAVEEARVRLSDTRDEPIAVPVFSVSTRLNDQVIDLVFTDEQAKLNVNAAYRRNGITGATLAVRRLAPSTASSMRSAELKPVTFGQTNGGGGDPAATVFGAYGQIWGNPQPLVLLGDTHLRNDMFGRGEAGLTEYLTCWGGGLVNIRRAHRDVLIETLQNSAASGLADAIVRLRDDLPGLTVEEVARRLDLNRSQRLALEERLTDGSSCHGLWVVVTGEQRARSAFAVSETRIGRLPYTHRRVWP